MKTIICALVFFFCTSVIGQTEQSVASIKIATVDTDRFYDSKSGIIVLAEMKSAQMKATFSDTGREWCQESKKRDELAFEALRKQIGEKLDEFSKENKFVLVIDKRILDSGAVIIESPDFVDITNDFIRFFNDWYEKHVIISIPK